MKKEEILKEFAEKLKEEIDDEFGAPIFDGFVDIFNKKIDKIKKEMLK